MNYITEILLIVGIVLLIIFSKKIQQKIPTARLFLLKSIVGSALITWVWIDRPKEIYISIIITVVVISHLYDFYKKRIHKA